MKYLYKIIRIFFCPHKYSKTIKSGKLIGDIGESIGDFYNKECRYCGKVKCFRTI